MTQDKNLAEGDSTFPPEWALPQWNFERRITSLRILAEFGMEQGVPAKALLAGTEIGEEQLADPDCTVSGRQELRLMKNLVERLGNPPGLGLSVGQRYHFTAFGALGLAFASSPTLSSALDLGQRFSKLTFGFARVLTRHAGREVQVTIDDSIMPSELRRFIVECTSAVMLTVGRDLANSNPPVLTVRLRYPAPSDVAPYRQFYGVRPVFRSSANLLVLERERLEHPLPLANAHVLRLSEQVCHKLLAAGQGRTPFIAKVRDRLERRIERMPDMDEVAEELHLTPRTLRRRLAKEGTSFRKVRDEVRMTRADELLAGPRLSLEQIAERVGYSDAASFVNAFKRCRGRTPRGVRLDNG
jgi:AraC-like DNA-binding protein